MTTQEEIKAVETKERLMTKQVIMTTELWDYLWDIKRDMKLKSLEEAIWHFIRDDNGIIPDSHNRQTKAQPSPEGFSPTKIKPKCSPTNGNTSFTSGVPCIAMDESPSREMNKSATNIKGDKK